MSGAYMVIIMIVALYIIVIYLVPSEDKKPVKKGYIPEKSVISQTFEPYLKKKLRKEILESKDFESCILALAKYSDSFGIKDNPNDFLLFKEHLDKLTIHE